MRHHPLIVTLSLAALAQAWFEELRRRYFPPERLLVGAHVTLFHALPGEREAELAARMADMAARTRSFAVSVSGVRNLGKGAAFSLDSATAAAVRAELASSFAAALTPQDQAKWQPHITIQNKVTAAEARETCAALAGLTPPPITATGLALWRYLNGPWENINIFNFTAQE